MNVLKIMTGCVLGAMMLTANVNIEAQNLKFGKPTEDEWKFTEWAESPGAEAVVLCKTQKVEYSLRGNGSMYDTNRPTLTTSTTLGSQDNMSISPQNTALTYDVKMRVKILKDSGKGYANVDIIYYNDGFDKLNYDEISSIEVTLFDKVDGKVKRTRISKATFTDERLDEHFMVRHIKVPEAKAGSIIEYKYELYSGRYAFLFDWQLEEKIPVMYSRCEMEIPAFLDYNMKVPLHPCVTKSVKAGTIVIPSPSIDLSAPKQCRSNKFLIESRNVKPFKEADAELRVQKDFVQVHAELLNQVDSKIVPLPTGKRHITLNP